jgi:hypothetical protein
MSKKIFITESQLRSLNEYSENRKITKYAFRNNIISFIKSLMKNPTQPSLPNELKEKGLTSDFIIKHLLTKEIIKKENKVSEDDGKSVYTIQYKVPKRNFESKIDSFYDEMISDGTLIREEVDVDGIDSMLNNNGIDSDEKMPVNEDGATSCAGVGAIGDGSDSSGEYTTPLFGKPISRTFYQGGKIKTKKT